MKMISRVERRKKETRDRILKTCEQIFVHEKNYAGVTIREIARRADVSTGALYLYFKTKEDIAANLIAEFTARQQNSLSSFVGTEGSGAERLIRFFDYLGIIGRDPHILLFSQLAFYTAGPSEVVGRAIRNSISNNFSSFVPFIADIFSAGKSDGTLVMHADPELLAVTIIDIFFSLIQGIKFQDFIFQSDNPFLQYFSEETIFTVFRDIISRGLFISPVSKDMDTEHS